ncbi:OmpH family outer membrane protein [Sinomicrobium weinanense]|uniref:OmpH family outer membrane protein n=1 Tax=Sinomicrobium weinanense TaxID=2842200 RepID=A0A926JSF4_9FLAO|nr:OmpH family outer membrane protein [Sinomicrobium weinanense]MBC9796667.1 OmpH family outer membrane protein [Sinomicrobium weinanense]MBU3124917.1 OmpH family outer membrane protein [Sinomicrobium weinanense]
MKAKVLFILLCISVWAAWGQRGVRIAYIDMEYILENVEEYKEASSQLDSRVEKWKMEVEEKKGVIAQMKKDLEAERVLLTKELIEEREEDINLAEEELREYQQGRFGPQGDMIHQKQLLVKPVQDRVFNAVQEIASRRAYDFVFDRSADVVMLYSDKKHDISDQVLKSIGRHRKTEQRNSGNAKNRFEEINREVDPERQAQKEEIERERDERARTLEEKRQQRIREREERQRAYEERRQQILEERKAYRKAREEKRRKKQEEKGQKTNEEEGEENNNENNN